MNSGNNKLHQKFEWNCGIDCENIKDGIIQIRQSGVRVKRPNFYPSLVAMRNTPIVWDKRLERYRYITPGEAAKLQSFDEGIELDAFDNEAYRQLGNSVNVDIIELLAEKLFNLGRWRKTYEKKN
jgi:DNA (cytosine-5)-methyltransferase 1